MTVISLPLRRSADIGSVPFEAFDCAPALTNHEPLPVYSAEGWAAVPGTDEPAHWTLTVPEEGTHRRLTGIAGGLGGVELAYAGLRKAMAAENDMPSFTLSTPRTGEHALRDPYGIYADAMAAVTEDIFRSAAVLDLPGGDKLDANQIDLALHSMAGLPGLRHAKQRPGDIHSMTFLESVGPEGKVGLVRFAGRILPAVGLDIVPSMVKGRLTAGTSRKAMATATYEYWRHPMMSAGEVWSCLNGDITPGDIEQLTEAGIATALLYGGRDHLILATKAVKRLKDYVTHSEIHNFDHSSPLDEGPAVAKPLAAIINHIGSNQRFRGRMPQKTRTTA